MDANTMKLRVEQWMPIFEAQARSGMTKNQWCDENGVRRWEFYERQRECREYMLKISGSASQLPSHSPSLPQQEFFELPVTVTSGSRNVVHDRGTDAGGHICVECGKFRISIDGRADKDVITALVSAVANA